MFEKSILRNVSHHAKGVVVNQQSVRHDRQAAPERPTEYTEEIGNTICGRLVDDESLRSICAEPGMPAVATVASWISNHREFRDMYARAREFQADCIADETMDLASEVSTQRVEKVSANGSARTKPQEPPPLPLAHSGPPVGCRGVARARPPAARLTPLLNRRAPLSAKSPRFLSHPERTSK
jgi:hypothetical protein